MWRHDSNEEEEEGAHFPFFLTKRKKSPDEGKTAEPKSVLGFAPRKKDSQKIEREKER